MKLTAGDVMMKSVRTIPDDRTVGELASFLIENGISGAPVMGKDGRLVGVVTATDVVQDRSETGESAAEGDARAPAGLARFDELRGLGVRTEVRLVRDIMTPTVYSIPEDLTLAEVARTMVAGRVHRLLVTRGTEVVGIVAALDLLKLFYEEPARVEHAYVTA